MLFVASLSFTLLFTLSECQKKGVIYTTSTSAADVKTCSSGCANIDWAYNYGQTPGVSTNGLEFVPQLFDTSPSRTSTWASIAQAQAQVSSETLLNIQTKLSSLTTDRQQARPRLQRARCPELHVSRKCSRGMEDLHEPAHELQESLTLRLE